MRHRFQVVIANGSGTHEVLELIAEKRELISNPGLLVSATDLGGWINPSQEWLGADEAAVHLGVHPSFIWDELVANGFLVPAVSGKTKWTRAELDEAMRRKMGLGKEVSLKRRAA